MFRVAWPQTVIFSKKEETNKLIADRKEPVVKEILEIQGIPGGLGEAVGRIQGWE